MGKHPEKTWTHRCISAFQSMPSCSNNLYLRWCLRYPMSLWDIDCSMIVGCQDEGTWWLKVVAFNVTWLFQKSTCASFFQLKYSLFKTKHLRWTFWVTVLLEDCTHTCGYQSKELKYRYYLENTSRIITEFQTLKVPRGWILMTLLI